MIKLVIGFDGKAIKLAKFDHILEKISVYLQGRNFFKSNSQNLSMFTLTFQFSNKRYDDAFPQEPLFRF